MEKARSPLLSEDASPLLSEDASPELQDFIKAVCCIVDIPEKSDEIAKWIVKNGAAFFSEVLDALTDGTLDNELGLGLCMCPNQRHDVTLRLQKKGEEDQKEKAYYAYLASLKRHVQMQSNGGYYAAWAAEEAAAEEAAAEEAAAEKAAAEKAAAEEAAAEKAAAEEAAAEKAAAEKAAAEKAAAEKAAAEKAAAKEAAAKIPLCRALSSTTTAPRQEPQSQQ
jgi:hypothetical protein